jgi:hypothetical protein
LLLSQPTARPNPLLSGRNPLFRRLVRFRPKLLKLLVHWAQNRGWSGRVSPNPLFLPLLPAELAGAV